jgi:gluconolactonase
MEYQIQKLCDLNHYAEGPVKGLANEWYVTTLSGGKVLRIQKDGQTSVWAEGDCPNGQVILGNGEHWLCESGLGQIVAYDAEGNFSRIIVDGICGGIKVQTPNDLLVDSSYNLYFTDSLRKDGKVFFRGADGSQACIAEGIDYANGIALNPDESRLFVAESYANRVRVYELESPGKLKAGFSCIDLPVHPSADRTRNLPDGLAVDQQGRLWVAHYGMQALQVIDSGGVWLFTLDTQLPLTSNVTFLSDTLLQKQLLVTGGYGEPGPGAVMLISVTMR